MIRRSKRTQARRDTHRAARREVVDAARDRDKNRCQAEHLVDEIRCGGPLDPHEIIPRSAWPAGDLDLDNVTIVCRRHHDWIDDHPAGAHELGLHRFSWERPT